MTPGKLPRDISGQEFRKAVARIGFALSRQKGSHMVLQKVQIDFPLLVDHLSAYGSNRVDSQSMGTGTM